ncbi:MAG: c-type cytochrome domain-containing protein, partial [Tunicatimonas sp.]|uniref:c-type cytochrome domain-containing protein n=1 Tax=Tunicatimonas sp. TaxID=1940096 RepID=UPI003C70DFEB
MPNQLTKPIINLDKFSHFRFLLIIFSIALLLLPLFATPQQTAPDWVYFLGRFHPLIIHFPIVLLSLLFLLELLNQTTWKVMSKPLRWVMLVIAALSSLLAVILGYLLYRTGDYSGDLVISHLWLGMGVAVGALLLLFFRLNIRWDKTKTSQHLYGLVLLLTNGLLVLASHQGGSLTHGADYLTDYLPSWQSVPEKPEAEMLVYNDVIVPMLDAKCYSCHNEHKTKGDLLLTSLVSMAQGGESGQPGLIAGDAGQSEIWKRVTLPPSHDDFMPPDGKPALTNTEVNLLEWWIDRGADPTLDYLTALEDSSASLQLQSYANNLRVVQRKQWKADKALTDLVQQVSYEAAPFIIERDQENSQQLTLQMPFPPGAFNDQNLIDLRPLYQQLVSVSLVGSDISEDALYHL